MEVKSQELEEEKKLDEVVKITISKEAESNLVQVLKRVNDGFDAGRINRQELASWALIQFAQDCDTDMIRTIRQGHFDELAFLESILKSGRGTGKLPQESKNALKLYLGMEVPAKRISKKGLTTNYINDVVSGNGEEAAAS